MGFNLGNATKYIWRCDLKKDAIEDLKKARWYIDREIAKREAEAKKASEAKFTAGIWKPSESTQPNYNIIVTNSPRLDETVIGKAASDALKYEGIR